MKGNISLSTVLITSSVLLLIGVALILTIIDFSASSKDYFNNELNEIQAKACLEESLQKIKTDNNFQGNFIININSGQCSIDINMNSSNSNYRDVNIISTLNSYTTKLTKRVDISQNPFTLINI